MHENENNINLKFQRRIGDEFKQYKEGFDKKIDEECEKNKN